jgi:hypothetical protein
LGDLAIGLQVAAAGAQIVSGRAPAAFRAALGRPGRVAFVIAGSRVTAMRHLIEDGRPDPKLEALARRLNEPQSEADQARRQS